MADNDGDSDEAGVLRPLQAAACTYRIALGERLHLIWFGVRTASLREVSGPPLREHGVRALNAKLRAQVVPQNPEAGAGRASRRVRG